jgi:cytochrome oxidase assembly protein ShyY1
MILAVAVTFPMLAAWQFDRWQEVRDEQERIEQRVEAAPVPIDQALPHDLDDQDAADLEFQPVTATGTWVVEEQVAQRNRALQGRAGFDWLTPLALDDGTAILVRRGFVPTARPGSADPAPGPAQAGTVTVTGWLERSVSSHGSAPVTPMTACCRRCSTPTSIASTSRPARHCSPWCCTW